MRSTYSFPRRATTGRRVLSAGLFLLMMGWAVPSSWAIAPPVPAADGQALYEQHCAKCHEGQVQRAPHRKVMSKLPSSRSLINAMLCGLRTFG